MGFALTSVLPWRLSRRENGEEPRSARWERLISVAKETAYYRGRDPNRMPALDLTEFYERYREFRSRVAEKPVQQPLRAPWEPLPRVAVVQPWFALEQRACVVMRPSCEELMDLKPEALAGPVDVLRSVARAVLQTRLRLPSVRFGVLAFAGISRPTLSEADRDLFWRAFEVPVTEQFRGFQGELLAMECERREGLHVVEQAGQWELSGDEELLLTSFENLRYPALRLATGLRGWIERGKCGCGNRSPRIRML